MSLIPLPFLLFLVFIAWLSYEIKSNSAKSNSTRDKFWSDESKANSVRKKNIDNLPYIKIPFDTLPFGKYKEDDLSAIESRILKLRDKKILKLSQYTNTELKLMYGPANLDILSSADDYYTTLIRLIYQWGDKLHQLSYDYDSTVVLEYGLEINSDISKHYILLGLLYANSYQIDKLNELINKAENLDSVMKATILNNLHDIKDNAQSTI